MEPKNNMKKVDDHVVMVQGRGKEKTIDQEVQNGGKDAISSGYERRGKEPRDAPEPQQNAGNTQIWFTLIASNEQDTNAPLQQIPSRFLRVKNVYTEVLYIKKYIATKLCLKSEKEVELYLMNIPLDSSMMLQDLLNYWTATGYGDVTASVGSSAAEVVMVLTYGRKSEHET